LSRQTWWKPPIYASSQVFLIVRKIYFITIFLIFSEARVASEAVDVKFGAGILLWGYGKNFILEANPEIKMDFTLSESRLYLNFGIPFFFGFIFNTDTKGNKQFQGLAPYFNGFSFADYHGYTWPKVLSSPAYLITYIKNISWETKDVQFSLTGETPNSGMKLQNIVWYNPFFDAQTGIINRYIFFKGHNAEFISSSLTNPSILYANYTLVPFKKAPTEFLKNFQIVPAFWIDVRNINIFSGGGALDFVTGSLSESKLFQIKLLTDAHFFRSNYIVNENLSSRMDIGALLQFKLLGFGLEYIYKSKHHPYVPFLSPLYGGRNPDYYSAIGKNHGLLLKLVPGIDSRVNFSLDTEIYPENPLTVSLKAQMRLNMERGTLNLAYIHENIVSLKDFANQKTADTFLEFDFKYYIIPDIYLIEWRHVLNFNNTSDMKTLLSFMAYF